MNVYGAPGEEEEGLIAPEPRLWNMPADFKGTYLMWAAQQGSLATVEALVQSGADVNEAGQRGYTALHYAAMKGQEVLVAFLLSKGAWAGARDADGRTAFTWAAQYGHVNVAQRLVEHSEGQWLNERDHEGRTPLMYAAAAGHDAMATLLLERHARADVSDKYGWTPLRLARENGHFGLAERLERHVEREDVKERERQGKELMRAVLEGDEERVGALLRDDAPTSMRDEEGMTPLILASVMGRVGVAIRLLEHSGRAGIDERDQDGSTALHYAAERGLKELVDGLLKKGAESNPPNKDGKTPLMLACERERVGVVIRLLEHSGRADIDERDWEGRTALHIAAERGYQGLVDLLLNKGAEASVVNAHGDTPLTMACARGHLGAAHLLVDHMERQWLDKTDPHGSTALHHAAERGLKELVKVLLNKGAEASVMDAYGNTPFVLACARGHLDVATLLVDHTEVQWLDKTGVEGGTALHYAAGRGREELVNVLLNNGAQASLKDRNGKTPLMLAYSGGYLRVVQRLARDMNPQELNERDGQGRTALHHAAERGLKELANLLLNKGAQASLKDRDGKTPLMLAFWGAHPGVVQRLARAMNPQELNERDGQGRTALHHAAERGHREMVATLLNERAQANVEAANGDTPLMLACRWVHLGVAHLLVEHMERQWLDKTDQDGRTALHSAAEGGYQELVDLLLNKGAQASVVDAMDRTPLVLACARGYLDVADLLVDHTEAEWLDKMDWHGRRALHWAAERGSLELVDRLLNKGAMASLKDRDGMTPLMRACERKRVAVAIRLLEQSGRAGIDERDQDGRTALHHAAEGGLEELVDCLLNKRAKASPKDRDGMTPFMRACRNGHPGVVQRLVRHTKGRGVDDRDTQGRTALHFAVVYGHHALVNILLSKGAQACVANAHGHTPLVLACWDGHLDVANMLVEHMEGQQLDEADQDGRTVLHWAAKCGHQALVNVLLNKGAQACVLDAHGDTPLVLACRKRHLGAANLLADHMEAEWLDKADRHGSTALHYAAEGGYQELMDLLLNKGAQACVEAANGGTPLTVACRWGHLDVAPLLVEHMEAQWLDRTDRHGSTALHHGAYHGLEGLVNCLLNKGAQASPKDRDGKTPLMLACWGGHPGVVQRLVRHMKGCGLDERDGQGMTALHSAAFGGRIRLSCFMPNVLPAANPTSYREVVRRLLFAKADPTLACDGEATPRDLAEQFDMPEIVAEFDRWPDVLKSLTLQRARWLQDVTATHAHDPTAPLPAPKDAKVLAARVADGRALPRLEMATGQTGEEGQASRALVEFLVVRVPDEPFREILGMLSAAPALCYEQLSLCRR